MGDKFSYRLYYRQGGRKMNLYFGDIPICYSHSTAMALQAAGYDFRSDYLEAIMVMGNGATLVKKDDRHPLVFFDNGMPDESISHCLQILGFDYEEFFCDSSEPVNVIELKEKLKKYLDHGSVIVGPLDMGYLTYNLNYNHLQGVDHFVSVYDMDEHWIYFHDPAGYPCVKMDFRDFCKAWKAEAIDYKRGAYSMWGNLQRNKLPTSQEIYHSVSIIMKQRYENGEVGIIEDYAKTIRANGLNAEQKQLHQFFSFRLAAIRSLYLSQFLKDYDPVKADLKEKIAMLFSQAYLDSRQEAYSSLADTLMEIAQLDGQFRDLCLQCIKG